jgi:hypothetical protein
MSTQKILIESTSTTLTQSGKRWKGILARPGQGSSGFYSEEVLREFGPAALAPGSKAFADHNPDRQVRDIVGIYPEGARYEEGVGLVGELEVFPHWADFVEAVAPHVGLSIYMMGETDVDGNIVELMPNRQNSVDLVAYPGLEGSGIVERLYESAVARSRQIENSVGQLTVDDVVTAIVEDEKMENQMDEQKIVALFEALTAKVDALDVKVSGIVTLSEQAAADVAANVDAFDVAEELTTAVAEAKLPESGRKRVIESVKAGVAVADAVAAEKAYVAEIVKQVSEAVKVDVVAAGQGRIVESTSGAYSFNDFVKVGA